MKHILAAAAVLAVLCPTLASATETAPRNMLAALSTQNQEQRMTPRPSDKVAQSCLYYRCGPSEPCCGGTICVCSSAECQCRR